jgi:hypothetical protein
MSTTNTAPDLHEESKGYNAEVYRKVRDDVLGPFEREQLAKLEERNKNKSATWFSQVVNDLVHRIMNLRLMVAQCEAERDTARTERDTALAQRDQLMKTLETRAERELEMLNEAVNTVKSEVLTLVRKKAEEWDAVAMSTSDDKRANRYFDYKHAALELEKEIGELK